MGNHVRPCFVRTSVLLALALALAPPLTAQSRSTTPDEPYSKLFGYSVIGGVIGAAVVGGSMYLLAPEDEATLVDRRALGGIVGLGAGYWLGQTIGGSRAAGGSGRFSVGDVLLPSLLWAALGGVVTGVVGDGFDPSEPYIDDYTSYYVGGALGALVSSAGFAWTLRRRMRPAGAEPGGVSLELRTFQRPNGELMLGGVLRH